MIHVNTDMLLILNYLLQNPKRVRLPDRRNAPAPCFFFQND